MKKTLAATLLLVAFAARGEDRLAQEIARLETVLKTVEAADLPKQVHDLFAVHRAALERAKKATSPEYKLYRLRDPFTGIETLAFLAEQKQALESVSKVNELWLAERPRFEAKPPKAHGSLLERALIESATTRADRLFHASLPYAKADAPWSGVYYLGEAAANLRFRDFILSIAGASNEKSPSRERVVELLDAVDRDTLKFFGSDVTNQAVVPVSVRLKETRELLDANRIDGAALLLVEARAALSRRGGPPATYPASDRNGSFTALLREWSTDEQPPMSDALREQIVPFAAALYAPASAEKKTGPAQVTVTLVRWPYT